MNVWSESTSIVPCCSSARNDQPPCGVVTMPNGVCPIELRAVRTPCSRGWGAIAVEHPGAVAEAAATRECVDPPDPPAPPEPHAATITLTAAIATLSATIAPVSLNLAHMRETVPLRAKPGSRLNEGQPSAGISTQTAPRTSREAPANTGDERHPAGNRESMRTHAEATPNS